MERQEVKDQERQFEELSATLTLDIIMDLLSPIFFHFILPGKIIFGN